MRESQRKYDADVKQTSLASPFALMTERLGPLPLINHFVERMDPSLPEQYVPASDPRFTMSQAQALGVLLRSIVVEREPLYRQQEAVDEFSPQLDGLSSEQMQELSDDRACAGQAVRCRSRGTAHGGGNHAGWAFRSAVRRIP